MPRPIAFDPEEKLNAAMQLFWRNGFEATSLQDLVEGLGINRFSIYNTFGDKRALFLRVLEHYYQSVFQESLKPLLLPERGLPCLEAYFSRLRKRLISSQVGEYGCLMQNTALENSATGELIHDYVHKVITELRPAFRNVLKAAVNQGQISPQCDIETCAVFLVAQVQGLLLARRVVGVEAVEPCVDFLMREIMRW
ncbi:MAG: TetR/AcrR family transcriptional regulator [Exilibacterium sp.]